MDDLLIHAPDLTTEKNSTSLLLKVLRTVGWLINRLKRKLTQSQSAEFFALHIDILQAKLFLMEARIQTLHRAIRTK